MTGPRTVAFSKHSTNLFFHILTQCNLECRHCYINPDQHGENMLSFATIQAWMEPFKPNSASTNLIVLGGEPTLHPDLPRILKYARSSGFGSITVDTNGYLFHDILSKIDPGVVDYFSFSLDGATRDTNDLIRGEGAFDACIAGIKKAVSMGFAVSLIFTVSRINVHELEKVGPLLKELGIHRFFIQVIGLRGKSAKMQDCRADSEQLQVSPSQWLDTVPGWPAMLPSRVYRPSIPGFFWILMNPLNVRGWWPTITLYSPTAGFTAVHCVKISRFTVWNSETIRWCTPRRSMSQIFFS